MNFYASFWVSNSCESVHIYNVIVDIMNKQPHLAWEMYLKMETPAESYSLLQMIANDCYKVSSLVWLKPSLSD